MKSNVSLFSKKQKDFKEPVETPPDILQRIDDMETSSSKSSSTTSSSSSPSSSRKRTREDSESEYYSDDDSNSETSSASLISIHSDELNRIYEALNDSPTYIPPIKKGRYFEIYNS